MRDKNTINRATFERCAKGYVFSIDNGACLLSERYAFNRIEEAAEWLVGQFVDEADQGPQCPSDYERFTKNLART